MTPAVSFRLPGKFLKAAAIFASTDQARYVLNGVQVEIDKDEILLVATDGRRLFAANVTEHATVDVRQKSPTSFIIPPDLIAKMPKDEKGGLGVWVELAHHRNRATVFIYNLNREESAPVIEGTYPKWREVIPTVPAVSATGLKVNGRFLDDFARANELLDKSHGLRVQQHVNEYGPYSIIPAGNWIGVLMPLREAINTIPAWSLPKTNTATQPAK